MAEEDNSYRKLIIERLEAVKQKNKQTAMFFRDYTKLAEQAQKERFAPPRTNGRHCHDSEELIAAKEELQDLYRTKDRNDQMLIDNNHKLNELEVATSKAIRDREALDNKKKELAAKYAAMEVELQKLRTDRDTMNDDRLALVTTVTMLTKQTEEMDKDRLQFLNKIRELNEQRVDFMNAEVDIDEKRRNRMQKIISDIENTPKDQKDGTVVQGGQLLHWKGESLLGDSLPSYAELSFQCEEGEVNDVHWISRDTFATGGSDRKVKIWELDKQGGQTLINTLTGSNQAITRIDYDQDRRHLIASSNDNNVRLWNVPSSRLLSTLSGHSDQVTCVKFYKFCSAVSGSADRVIKVWDLANERCHLSLFPASKVLDIATGLMQSPSLFASGHFDKKIRFYDVRSSDPVNVVEMGARITSLDVSMNERELLVSTRDDTITLLELRMLQTAHCYSAENYRTSSDFSRVIVSAGDEYIAAGSANGNIFVWNKNTTKLEKKLMTGTENPIFSLSWCPTGIGLLSGSKHKMVAHWK